MCGINGIFAYHSAAGLPKEHELLATREAMRARGPDGSGAWWSADRRCGLGHRRLTIIDLSEAANQPMVSADGRYVITFNGEIYNYRELRAELAAAGSQFCTTSDTEILLHLYARHGAEMVHRLRGMYAFAIWDDAQRQLFLARDPYGIKPLYTANDGWTFRFASQVKALLAGGQVSRDPEPAGIVGFHLFGSVPEPFTLYREIRTLPAGYTQVIDIDGPQEPRPFTSIAAMLAEGALHPTPASELADRVRESVRDSVQAHLVADVEVGHFLSAGIDSGAVLGVMRDAGQSNVRAITLGFDEFRNTSDDEVPLAARVADYYNAEHTVRWVNKREFDEDLPGIFDAMDQPSIDGINTWFVAKVAKEAGLKVALSGLGGDELFAGYPSFVDLPRWRQRFGVLAAIPGLAAASRLLIGNLFPDLARRQPKALGFLQYARDWPGLYLLRRGLFLPQELGNFLEAGVVFEGLRRLKPLASVRDTVVPDPGSAIGRVCALESANYLRNQLLRDADWAGMAHGVEIRVPLVDVDLLKSLAPFIPTLRPGNGKVALANAPSLPLPSEILSRAKTGFGVPIGSWLTSLSCAIAAADNRVPATQAGAISRHWSRNVLTAFQPRSLAPVRVERPVPTDTVLIFRIGSIGDTVIALPCFHGIARAFPNHRRILITDSPAVSKAAPVEAIIGRGRLIDDVIYFPPPPRKLSDLLALRAIIRETAANTLVYIVDRGAPQTIRDICFFWLCGVRRIIGASLARELRRPRVDPVTGEGEREATRLARCLSSLGAIDLHDPAMWDLGLQPDEHRAAAAALAPLNGRDFIAVSVGGKSSRKDWGDPNWRELLDLMATDWPRLALVFVGAAQEVRRCEDLAKSWPGQTINLCGKLIPRESAAALQQALIYLGHDCGPMHLAAAVGVPCVAMFGDYNKPKWWHPVGAAHRIIHDTRGLDHISAADVRTAVSSAMAFAKDRPQRTMAPVE